MLSNPPSTGDKDLDNFLKSVKRHIDDALRPADGWRLSDFSADVSEVISDKRDLIDIVTAYDDINALKASVDLILADYAEVIADSKAIGKQYEDHAEVFSHTMEWWNQNRKIIEDAAEAMAAALQASDYADAAEAAALRAGSHEDGVTQARDDAVAAKNEAQDTATQVADQVEAAASHAGNAQTSAQDAATSATNAKTSETNAKTSETRAKTSETNAKTSETNAKASENRAKIEADRAENFAATVDYTKKADLVDGVVPTSQIPAVALTKPHQVASREEMLTLADVQEGDVVVITSGTDKGTYMLGSGASSDFASWVELAVSQDAPVRSVNGQTGTVALSADDVDAAPKVHGHTWEQIDGRPVEFPPEAHGHTLSDLGEETTEWVNSDSEPNKLVRTGSDGSLSGGTPSLDSHMATKGYVDAEAAKKADSTHEHTAEQISNATTTGRNVLKANSKSEARSAIGAGTSNLALGTTSSTAAAGDHTHSAADVGASPVGHKHTASDISDATATGRNVLTASSQAAARQAIGAGTSSLTLGTTSSTAAAGNHTHTPESIGAAPASHTHSQYATTAQVEARTPEIRVVSSPDQATLPGVLYVVEED